MCHMPCLAHRHESLQYNNTCYSEIINFQPEYSHDWPMGVCKRLVHRLRTHSNPFTEWKPDHFWPRYGQKTWKKARHGAVGSEGRERLLERGFIGGGGGVGLTVVKKPTLVLMWAKLVPVSVVGQTVRCERRTDTTKCIVLYCILLIFVTYNICYMI